MPRSTARNNREVHRRPIDLQADEGLISLLRDQPPSTAQRFGGTGLGLAITRKPARMGSLFGHKEANMDNTTLLIIIILVVILLGGGWYGRGRWF
jgi:hypothetical protein